MTGSSPASAPSRRLPPVGRSASEARRFVAAALAEVDEDLLDTVALLTSELVTNAILHAGTDLEVRVWATGGRVHVSVFDEAPARTVRPRGDDLEATTGRGLQLVELLSSAHGTDISPEGKTVWFELWPGRDTGDPTGWTSPPRPVARPGVHIELRSVPVGLCRAAGRHRRALLREGRLALGASGPSAGVTLVELQEATCLSDLIDTELESRLHTLAPGQPSFDCTLVLPPDCGAAATTLVSVLHRLNAAAGAGRLLTRPALPEIRHFRGWLADQISSQADGAPPIPWSRPVEPGAADVAASGVDWELELDPTGPATIAADDDNRIIAVNDAAGRLLGWDPDQLRGQRLVAVIPEGWRERHVTGFTEFLLTGHSRIIGTTVRLPALRYDGSVIEANVVITVEQSRQGRTVFLARLTPADDDDRPAPCDRVAGPGT
jgi:PAS domain S-box-containing protein